MLGRDGNDALGARWGANLLSEEICWSTPTPQDMRKLCDGGGLQLWLVPSGSRLWRFAYIFEGKQRALVLGAYPAVDLAAARDKAERAKALLLDHRDPVELKYKDPIVRRPRSGRASSVTFGQIAKEYLATVKASQCAATTLSRKVRLLSLAEANLYHVPIDGITLPDILTVLRKLEGRGRFHSTHKLLSMIGAVFRFGVATGRAVGDPTPVLRGALVREKRKHFAALIEPETFGALLRAVDGYEGHPMTRAGLQLLALLFPRPGELRKAQWAEFDRQSRVWTIPAEHTKMRRSHLVPLSSQSVKILDDLHAITGHGTLLFPSLRTPKRWISSMTFSGAIRSMGFSTDQMTAHGFRASASTLLNECAKWQPQAIERQLAHKDLNQIRRAYVRGEYWQERVRMMQWWADYLDRLRKKAKLSRPRPHRTWSRIDDPEIAPPNVY